VTSPLDIIASQCRPLDLGPRVRTGAVYFLVSGDEIVYVGQTLNVEQRIAWHVEQSKIPTIVDDKTKHEWPNHRCKVFDRAFALDVPEARLRPIENVLIRRLWPRYNRRATNHVGDDNQILASMGLPIHDDEYANAAAFARHVYTPRFHTRKNYRRDRMARSLAAWREAA
jgi:hypothetical protein